MKGTLALDIPNIVGTVLAMQVAFLNVGTYADCVGVSNPVAFQVMQ